MREYDVGYGKPPCEYRWQKGESGNPSGRKRKKPDKDIRDLVEDLLSEKVTVEIGGKKKKIPLMEASLRSYINQALSKPGGFFDLEYLRKHFRLVD